MDGKEQRDGITWTDKILEGKLGDMRRLIVQAGQKHSNLGQALQTQIQELTVQFRAMQGRQDAIETAATSTLDRMHQLLPAALTNNHERFKALEERIERVEELGERPADDSKHRQARMFKFRCAHPVHGELDLLVGALLHDGNALLDRPREGAHAVEKGAFAGVVD